MKAMQQTDRWRWLTAGAVAVCLLAFTLLIGLLRLAGRARFLAAARRFSTRLASLKGPRRGCWVKPWNISGAFRPRQMSRATAADRLIVI